MTRFGPTESSPGVKVQMASLNARGDVHPLSDTLPVSGSKVANGIAEMQSPPQQPMSNVNAGFNTGI